MANPNLGLSSNVYANNASVSLTSTSATQLVSNAASSGKVFVLDHITVANIDTANAVNVTVTFYRTADNSGTAYELASTVSIPANSALIVIDRTQQVTLLEAQSIYVTAGTASKLKVNSGWKELS
jgi:NADH:ubiquinone oxidoreductase subunit K